MTDEELKALVAENSLAIREYAAFRQESEKRWQESRRETEALWQEIRASRRETEALWQEIRASREESEKRWQESRKRWQESRRESEKRWQEWRRESEEQRQECRWESERLSQEIVASREETDRLITSFNRQLGRLGNALGSYTESLFRPSLKRALREQFGMTVIHSPLCVELNGGTFEVDMVGHGNGDSREVYLAEIKSQLRQDGIEQILDDLRQLPWLFPEHRGKKLFGILAALDIPSNLRIQVLRKGLYLATIKDDVFEIVAPDDFTPRAFGLREA